MDLAVGREAHEAIEAGEARRVERLAHTDASDLVAVLLAAAFDAFAVVERRRALGEGLLQITARNRSLLSAELRVHLRTVDTSDLEPIDAELARGLVDQRLDGGHGLVVAGTALRNARNRVRHHAGAAETHRGRLIQDRHRVAGRRPVGEPGGGP